LTAPQLNGNFTAVTTAVNGALDHTNLSSSAAITASQLNLTSEFLNLQSTGNPAWAAGIGGDTVPRVSLMSQGAVGFGAGSSSALDAFIIRLGSNSLAVQNAGATAYGTFTAAQFTANDGTHTVNLIPANIAHTNGALYVDGSGNIQAAATGGSGRQVFTSIGGATPAFASSASFGGDGSSGAVTDNSTGFQNVTQYNATTYQLNDSVTRTWGSGTILNATSTITIGQGSSGTITVNKGFRGGLGAGSTLIPTNGFGPTGGQADQSRTNGSGGSGGGGSYIGAGNGASGSGGLQTQATLTQAGQAFTLGGSGGGGGGMASSSTGGAGGDGGGYAIFCAVGTITISSGATVTATGGTGSAGGTNGGGGGGGGGGCLIFASQTSVVNNGTINPTGGNGGNGAGTGGGGGGGGGGIALFWAPSITAGTVTTTAASAGSGGSGSNTSGGASAAISITGTPNMPLLTWVEKHARELAVLPSHNLKQSDLAAIAANGDVVKYLTYISGSLDTTCEAIGDEVVLGNAA